MLDPIWRAEDTYQVCHAFAIGGDEDGEDDDRVLFDPATGEPAEPVVCRGFYEQRYLTEGVGQLLQIAERLRGDDAFDFVEVPEGAL